MDARETELLRRHMAYHEAGHVIADIVFGYRFTSVTIRPDESGEYEGGVYGSTRGRARNLAVIQLAGIVAAARMAEHDPWESPPQFDDDRADIATARRFVDNRAAFVSRTYGGSSVREQLWDETKEKTRQLVEGNRDAIEVIAGALLTSESLSYDDVMALLKDQCPDFKAGEPIR